MAQWQGPNNVPDTATSTTMANTSDNSNTLTITGITNDLVSATFTVQTREATAMNANQQKAFANGAWVWTRSVKYNGTTINELSSSLTFQAFQVTGSTATTVTVAGTFGAARGASTTAAGTLAQWSADPTTGYPGTYYSGDMGCLNCHSMPVNIPNRTFAIKGSGQVACSSDSACGPLDRNGYILTGHKNMLRKVLPPSATPYGAGPFAPVSGMLGPDGNTLPNTDAAGNVYDWTTGLVTPVGGTAKQLFYVFGWAESFDALWNGGGSTSNYQCARCHTTGYRFDDNAPEPTKSTAGAPNTYTTLTTTELKRVPAGWTSGATSSWQLTGIQCERCHNNSHADSCANQGVTPPTIAGQTVTTCEATKDPSGVAHYAKPYQPVNVQATALCLECHRQERTNTSSTGTFAHSVRPWQVPGLVSDGGSCSNPSLTTGLRDVAAYNACLAGGATWNYKPAAKSHNQGTTFLNSPHARFVAACSDGVSLDETTCNTGGGKWGLDQSKYGSVDLSVQFNGTYNSFFEDEGQGLSTANSNNGGCTNCHNPHYSNLDPAVVSGDPAPKPFSRECTECHTNNRYAVGQPAHSMGVGTPFPNGTMDADSCVTCHMQMASAAAPSNHWFRINPDPNYYTFPTVAQFYAAPRDPTTGNTPLVAPNTFVEQATNPATFQPISYNAVAQDVDIACGQCHGGGTGNGTNPYGIVSTGAPAFSRAQLANAAVNMHNTVSTTAVKPTFSLAAGTYAYTSAPLSVMVNEATIGALICYTTDGITPPTWTDSTPPPSETANMVCNGTVGFGPISVSQSTTIQAVAGGVNSIGVPYTSSPVASATYNIQAPTPSFSVGGGMYGVQQSVGLSDAVGGASITYCTVTMGGLCTPSTAYAAPIAVSVPTTIYAKAGGAGYATSSVVQAAYNIVPSAPTFSPGSGTYVGAQTVTVNGPAGSTIYYTINGSVPTTSNFAGTVPAGGTVAVPRTEYLRAIAVYTSGSQTAKSSVATAVYSIR